MTHWLSEWLNDKVTYWVVLDSKQGDRCICVELFITEIVKYVYRIDESEFGNEIGNDDCLDRVNDEETTKQAELDHDDDKMLGL